MTTALDEVRKEIENWLDEYNSDGPHEPFGSMAQSGS